MAGRGKGAVVSTATRDDGGGSGGGGDGRITMRYNCLHCRAVKVRRHWYVIDDDDDDDDMMVVVVVVAVEDTWRQLTSGSC